MQMLGAFSCLAILSGATPNGIVNLQVRDGHPIVDHVFVNGHGPYRFLIDTATNMNLIRARLAVSLGFTASFRTELASSIGTVLTAGGDGFSVRLESVIAENQRFLFSDLDAIERRWPDVQGVLGQSFLSSFDYVLDLRGRRLEFGRQDRTGTRTRFRLLNGRAAVSTSLGTLVLDSAADRIVLFGVSPQSGYLGELRTFTGSQTVGVAPNKPLIIEGRRIRTGDPIAIPARAETGVDGLMPLSLFKAVYVCNSEGYVVLDQ
jgi:hypothetical protein